MHALGGVEKERDRNSGHFAVVVAPVSADTRRRIGGRGAVGLAHRQLDDDVVSGGGRRESPRFRRK